MARVWIDIPKMIDGVSNQPDSRRFRSQAESISNAWLSLVDGLDKRNGGRHVAKIIDAAPSTNFWTHWIDIFSEVLDEDPITHLPVEHVAPQRYLLVGSTPQSGTTGILRAFTLGGVEVHIEDTASTVAGGTLSGGGNLPPYDYLASGGAVSSRENFKAHTVADNTFIINRTVATAMDPAFKTTSAAFGEAFISVRSASYAQDYEVIIETTTNGVNTVTTETWDGSGSEPVTPPVSPQAEVALKTDDIAEDLRGRLGALTGITATRVGSVIKIVGSSGEELVKVETHDSVNDVSMESLFQQITTAVDLPLTCEDGFKIRVSGDANIGGDDYFIQFNADETGAFGEGSWEQTIDHDTEYQFDATTMPHRLLRQVGTGAALPSGYSPASGERYFEFTECPWEERITGDEELVPDPSFIGQTIERITLARNRLVLLADDNVILSEVNGFFNFWRTDITNLLDTDTIDIAISHNDVSYPRNIVGFENDIILWTDRNQFRIPGEELLTPKTVSARHISTYYSDLEVEPVMADTGVYFVEQVGQFSLLRELFRRGDSNLFDSANLSEQIPRYKIGTIREITASSKSNVVACVVNDPTSAQGNEDTLWIYKFHWSGNERTQSAWSRWSMGAEKIMSCHFYDDKLYMLVERNSQMYLEYIETSEGGVDDVQAFRVKMDRGYRVQGNTGTYDSQNNLTRYVISYDLASTDVVQVLTHSFQSPPDPSNALLNVSVTNRDTPGAHYIDVVGDATVFNDIWIGIRYDMEYEFGSLLMKEPTQTGEKAIASGPNQVIDMILVYEESGPFEVQVTPRGSSQTYTYEARLKVLNDQLLGGFDTDTVLSGGEFPIPIMCAARDVTIKIVNRLPYPAKMQRAELSVDYRPRHKRQVK